MAFFTVPNWQNRLEYLYYQTGRFGEQNFMRQSAHDSFRALIRFSEC